VRQHASVGHAGSTITKGFAVLGWREVGVGQKAQLAVVALVAVRRSALVLAVVGWSNEEEISANDKQHWCQKLFKHLRDDFGYDRQGEIQTPISKGGERDGKDSRTAVS